MTVRHCRGCRGYTRGSDSTCPGAEISILDGEIMVPDEIPPGLPFLSRLKVLLGAPVLLGVSVGPLDDDGDHYDDPWADMTWSGKDKYQ